MVGVFVFVRVLVLVGVLVFEGVLLRVSVLLGVNVGGMTSLRSTIGMLSPIVIELLPYPFVDPLPSCPATALPKHLT